MKKIMESYISILTLTAATKLLHKKKKVYAWKAAANENDAY
jgi:hypothetical protein